MNEATWQFCALLPNLRLQKPIGNDHILLVPFGDERLQKLSCQDQTLSVLLNKFSDQFGLPQKPSGILAREVMPMEMIIAFRNIVAISCIIGESQRKLIARSPISDIIPVVFSDYFDLYPITPVRPPGIGLLTNSYAGIGGNTVVENFRGQISPLLLSVEQAIPIPDGTILSLLFRQWEAYWQNPCDEDMRSQRLLRSFQVAYHAATMISKNQASLIDYGVSIIHWISAIEILLNTGKNSVNEYRILQMLARLSWSRTELQVIREILRQKRHNHCCEIKNCPHKLAVASKREPLPLNLIKLLYHQLYRARNAFVHGNDLQDSHFLSPLGNVSGPNWLTVAPLIFKATLLVFFGESKTDETIETALVEILRRPPSRMKTKRNVRSRGAS